jgi:hypothetical protein
MVKTLTIELEGKSYIIKMNNECLIEYESIANKGAISGEKSMTELFMLYYCMVKVNNIFNYTFKEFVKLIDKNVDEVDEFNSMVESYNNDKTNEVKKILKVKALDVFTKYFEIEEDKPVEPVKKKKVSN